MTYQPADQVVTAHLSISLWQWNHHYLSVVFRPFHSAGIPSQHSAGLSFRCPMAILISVSFTYGAGLFSFLDKYLELIRCAFVVTDALPQSSVVVLSQTSVLHHLKPAYSTQQHITLNITYNATRHIFISVIFIQIIECSDISEIYVCLLHACSTLTICWILSMFICSQLAHSHLNRWNLFTPAQPQNLHAHSSLTK